MTFTKKPLPAMASLFDKRWSVYGCDMLMVAANKKGYLKEIAFLILVAYKSKR